jgi:hypothetical protein
MTPQYILQKSLCRKPHCAGPHNVAFKDWSLDALAAWRRRAESEIEWMDYATEYAEGQGYDNSKRGILFANWNLFPSRVGDILEKSGYSCEWSDEWTHCDDCGKALRMSPDSHGWQPSYIAVPDSGVYCVECLTAENIESLENNPRTAFNVHGVDLKDYGYIEIECGFESGWHSGQDDDPQKIFDSLKTRYPRLLFQISGIGQFDMHFCIWQHPEIVIA